MELIATKATLPYAGKTYRRGDRFTATEAHGRLLILVKAAVEAPARGYAREDFVAEEVAGSERAPQEYARRDLEARVISDVPVKRKRGRPRKVQPA